MITIEHKALIAAKEKNASFVIKTLSTSGGCCDMDVKDIVVELKEDFKGTYNHFHIFEYDGIKVFIEKYLKLEDEIKIYERVKLPIIGSIFKVMGVSVKYM
ncbi:MAG: hypothetical protein ACM3X7_12150 [Solirubrobacterales bacterium]